MTQYTEEKIKEMESFIVGKKVQSLYHVKEDDYFVMEFEDGTETSFRFMADIMRENK